MRGRSAKFMAGFQALLLMATLVLPALAAATTITTDLWVYQDGDTVTVNGIDFGANEVVDFVSTDPDGVVVDTGSSTSDDTGAVVYPFVLHATQPGIYDVVGTGETSGFTATTQFDPGSVAITGAPSFVWYTSTSSFDVTVAGTFSCTTGGSGTARCSTPGLVDVGLFPTDNANNSVAGAAIAPIKSAPTVITSGTCPSNCSGTWTTTYQFRSSPGAGQYALPAAILTESKYDARATFNWTGASGAGSETKFDDNRFGIDITSPTASLSVTAGTLGTGGWYTSNVTVHTAGSDTAGDPLSCTSDQVVSTETTGIVVSGSCTDQAGQVTNAAPITIKLDKSAPAAALSITAGTAGTNGWRTSDVTVHTAGTDAISGITSCTTDQFQTAETTGIAFNGSCTNGAGLSTSASSLTVKLDKSAPAAATLAVTAGTLGSNGWYTSNVTATATGTDSISTPVVCAPSPQAVSTETTGTTLNAICTNDAGLSTSTNSLSVKLDKTGPVVLLTVTGGTLGTGGWYTSDVTVHTSGTEGVSVPVSGCTADQAQTTNTAGTTFNGSCVDDAGLIGNATPVIIKLDKLAPTSAVLTASGSAGVASASGTASDAGPSGLNSGNPKPLHVEIHTGSCAGTLFAGSGLDLNAPGGNWSYGAPSAPSAPGTYYIVSLATDMAGNVQAVAGCNSYTIASADSTPPVITKVISGTAGASGWYRSDVSVAWTVTDPETAVVIDSGCGTQSFTTETAAAVSSCTAHSVGGSSTDSVTIKIDKTAPLIGSSATANALAYTAGTWTKYDVAVSFTCADTGLVQSGIASNTVSGDNATVTTEGSAQSRSSDGACVDTAGNADTSETFSPIKIDKTAPVISSSATANALAYTAGTWTKYDVAVSFTCADTGLVQSGIASNTVSGDNATVTTEGSAQSRSSDGACVDTAGNADTSETFSPIKIDKTAPVITDEGPTTSPNGNSWYDHAVDNEFSVTDNLSGLDASCDTAFGEPLDFQTKTTASEGAAVHVTSDGCTDNAGNTASGIDSADFMVALSGPVINDDGPATLANLNGWYNSNVVNGFSVTPGVAPLTSACLAAFSGVGNSQTKTTSGEGTTVHVTSDGCSDLAGFSTVGNDSTDFQIDKTKPVITGLATPAANASGWNNTNVVVGFTCTDPNGTDPSGIDTDTVAGATLSSEGAGQSVTNTGACVDNAGNAATSATVSGINIDKTAPIISSSAANADLSAYTAGTWTNQSVTVSFSCADSGLVQSLIATNTVSSDNQTLTAETAGTNVSSDGQCVDNAGNSDSSETFGPVKIDKTAPVIGSSAIANALAYTAGTWTRYDVAVSFTCADTGLVQSGIVADTVSADDETVSTETSGTNVDSDGLCVDAAGNDDTSSIFGPIKIDKTAPIITGLATPAANANGWNNTNVSVTFTCADAGTVQSGIVTNTAAGDNQTLIAETAGISVSSNGDCIDAAGNSDSSESVGPIRIDKTAPVIAGVASPGANANGWNTGSVSVSFTCADQGLVQSGIDVNTVAGDNQVLTAETTGTTVSSDGTCLDQAGNSDSSETVGPIKIDLTNPSVAITSPTTGLVAVSSFVTMLGTASDTPSGIDTVTVNGQSATWSAGSFSKTNMALNCGTNTFSAIATDKSGRSTASNTVMVTRVCIGSLTYYQPLDQSITSTPIINSGKMGRVIPVKVTGTVSLGGGQVAMTDAYLAANGLTVRIGVNGSTCGVTSPTDLVEAYADAGAANDGTNLFRWSTSQWIYNLDTGKAPSVSMKIDACYRLDVYLQDAGGSKILLSSGPTPGTNPYVIFKPTK